MIPDAAGLAADFLRSAASCATVACLFGPALPRPKFPLSSPAPMRHIISILLVNEAGALSRVAGLFSARGYNIESLNVAPTQNPSVSRLTMVTVGSDEVIEQINKQLRKLVDVVDVSDLTEGAHIEREVLLLKLEVSAAQVASLRSLLVQLGAEVLDDTPASFTMELTGTGPELDEALQSLGAQGRVLEVVRSGAAAIGCGGVALKIPA